MKVYSFNNDFTFGHKKGGVKHLRIIKGGNNIFFVNTTKEISDVSVFVAGGSEVDRKVREANFRISAKHKGSPSSIAKKKPLFLGFMKKFLGNRF